MLRTDETNTLVTARSLSVFYGERSVFRDLSFSIPLGAKCYISGTNGAGKSSLLRCLAGIQRPSEGEVFVAGHPLVERAGFNTYKKDYSPVFLEEQDAFYPQLSVEENISFAEASNFACFENSNENKERLRLLLEELELKKYLKQTAVNLSRGERRRLSLLLTLLGEPKIIFLDEPFVALDSRSRNIFQRVLGQLSVEQTLFLVSHDRELAGQLCGQEISLDEKELE